MDNIDVLKATILHKLKRRNKWGRAHTSIDLLTKGIPKNLRGKAKEAVKEQGICCLQSLHLMV